MSEYDDMILRVHKEIVSNKEKEQYREKKEGYIAKKATRLMDKTAEKIPSAAFDVINMAFAEAFSALLIQGTPIVEKTFAPAKIRNRFFSQKSTLSKHITSKGLNKIDKSAKLKASLNKYVTAAEGTALGFLGIGLPDVPVFIGMILKSIYEISLSYGFDYRLPFEKQYILLIICAAVSESNAKQSYFKQIDEYALEISENKTIHVDIPKTISEASELLAKEILVTKAIQGFFIVGAVGGISNYATLDKITTTALIKYKKRFLEKLESERTK